MSSSGKESLKWRLCSEMRSRLESGVEGTGANSRYPLELTASRSLLMSLYHSLLLADAASVFLLLALEPALPQLGSSSAAVWLCEDFRFQHQDVATVLSRLGHFIELGAVPPSVVSVFTALARKYRFIAQDECPYSKKLLISVATQTTAEAVVAPGRVFSRLESTPEEISQEENNNFPEKLPVFYAMSLSVESIPTEIAGELKTKGARTPQSPDPNFETMLDTGLGPFVRPLPSAPSLSAFDLRETGLEQPVRETEPIYENIPAFKEFSSKTLPAVMRRNTKRSKHLVENRKSEGSLTETVTITKLQNRRSDSLLRSGVATNISKADATKWLLKASERGDSAEAAIALSAGASTEGKDSLRRSPLHMAVASGHQPLIRMLLDAGADKNKRDTLGRTPLHYTALRGRPDIARMLLDAGADLNIRDSSGLTPTSLAAIKNHRGVAALLKSRGGHECSIS